MLERVRVRGRKGIETLGPVTIRDAFIEAVGGSSAAVFVYMGSLVIERVLLAGGDISIGASNGTIVDISNVIAYGTTGTAFDLAGASGSISFATVVDAGANSGAAAGLACPVTPGVLTVRSSIIWTPGAAPATSGACRFESTIAGPVGAVGALNVDPRFVNPAARDYHLSASSPARDMVDTGPATDFERDPRPRGPRFDIGADEAE